MLKNKFSILTFLSILFFINIYPKNRGLQNCGNSCYFNASIQCLSHLHEFNKQLDTNLYKSDSKYDKIARGYINLVKNFISQNKKGDLPPISPPDTAFNVLQNLYSEVTGNKTGQQDALQFFDWIFMDLHLNNSLIDQLVGFTECSENQKFGHESHPGSFSFVREPTISDPSIARSTTQILTLSIPDKTQITLKDCLKNYSSREQLQENERLTCDLCKKKVVSFKSMKISKFARYLIISFKRYNFNKFGAMQGTKKDNPIQFPIELEFTQNDIFLDSLLKNRLKDEKLKYNLIAFACQGGGTGGGHYWAYCKDQVDGKWYNYDDSSVAEIDITQYNDWSSPYIIFYELDEHSLKVMKKIEEGLKNSPINKKKFMEELLTFEPLMEELLTFEPLLKKNTTFMAIKNSLINFDKDPKTDPLNYERLYFEEFVPIKKMLYFQKKLIQLKTSLQELKIKLQTLQGKLRVLKGKL